MLLELSLKVVANFFEILANYFPLGRNSSFLENYQSKNLKASMLEKNEKKLIASVV